MSVYRARKTKEDTSNPEAAMIRDIAAKASIALDAFTVSRAEFIVWYTETVGTAPEWTYPPVNWMFNSWIAAQGEREWLTQVEIDKREAHRIKMLAVMAKRKESKEAKKLQPIDKKAAAAERKRVSNKETSFPSS